MPAGAGAAPTVALTLPASTLDMALLALSRAAGIDIISTEAGLRAVATPALSGRMTVRVALDRLLAGSGYRAIGGAEHGYRIVRARPPRHRPTPPPSVVAPPPSLTPEIVVTASKQRVPLIRYPGTVTLIGGSPVLPGGVTADPSDLARLLPVIQSTQLGPGRNKVFIRGVADSSFNGTTLSTVSVYLDDVQLSASGPDPGLRLYDMRSVEVMEGPQGTLYGAGSIGGVVRLTANAPDLGRAAASVDAGASATQGGSPGADAAMMVNVPLAHDRLAVRAVAYGAHEGGYVDDRARGLTDVNRTDLAGGRLAVRLDAGDGWRVEAGGALQAIRSRDGQYAMAGDGPLARRTALAQPFTGDFRFGRLVVSKEWDSGLSLVSASGIAAYDTTEVFDASAMATTDQPVTSRSQTDKLLISHEMRLSRVLPGRSWLAGVTLISDRSVLYRSAGALGSEADTVGVRNVTRAASAFGEATVALLRNVSVTLGGRYTIARVDSEPSQLARAAPYVKGQLTHRLDPTAALSWRIAPDLAVFARHQTGFRTGGLAVARGIGRVANYQADSINLDEIGMRRLPRSPTALGLSLTASRAYWTGIQADLVSRRGQPYTTNVGDARILALEGAADWMPVAGLKLTGSALYTYNTVYGAIADQSQRDNRRLPETPALGGHTEVSYAWAADRRYAPRLGATLTYVGRSVLGTGDLLDVRQGGYTLLSASAGVRHGRVDLTLALDNLTNRLANRFAFGNPFGLAARDQITPLRPRTLRLGVASHW